MENKWQVPGDAPSPAAVAKAAAPPLTHSANFPESRDAPRSRKRSGNRRANVCKQEPGLRSVELPPMGPAGRCHPRRPRTGRASPPPRDAGLSLGPRARTCHGPPRSKDGEGDREKPKDGCAGRFLPARCKTISKKRGQNPPETPSQARPLPAHGSWVSSQGWPHRMSPPQVVAASWPPSPKRFRRSCLFPSSCLRDTGALRSCRSPEIRQPRASGQGRQRPFRARAPLCLGSRGKTTGAISGFTAPEKVLAHPQAPKARQTARGWLPPPPPPGTLAGEGSPRGPLQGRGDDGACAAGWVQLFGDAGASWQRAELEESWWLWGQARGSPRGTGQSHTRRGASRSLRPWGQGTLRHLGTATRQPPASPRLSTLRPAKTGENTPSPQKSTQMPIRGEPRRRGRSCHAARATALSDFARFLVAQHVKTAAPRPAAVPSPLLFK